MIDYYLLSLLFLCWNVVNAWHLFNAWWIIHSIWPFVLLKFIGRPPLKCAHHLFIYPQCKSLSSWPLLQFFGVHNGCISRCARSIIAVSGKNKILSRGFLKWHIARSPDRIIPLANLSMSFDIPIHQSLISGLIGVESQFASISPHEITFHRWYEWPVLIVYALRVNSNFGLSIDEDEEESEHERPAMTTNATNVSAVVNSSINALPVMIRPGIMATSTTIRKPQIHFLWFLKGHSELNYLLIQRTGIHHGRCRFVRAETRPSNCWSLWPFLCSSKSTTCFSRSILPTPFLPCLLHLQLFFCVLQ